MRLISPPFTGLSLLALCCLLTACIGGRVHPLTENRYPAKGPHDEIDLFIGKVKRPYEPIALIDSRYHRGKDVEAKQRMLEELRSRARQLGGDAVHDIRLLPIKVQGIVADENVPVPGAWTQGERTRYFLRGEVLHYVAGFGAAPDLFEEETSNSPTRAKKRPAIDDSRPPEPATTESLRIWSLDEGE